MILSNKNYNKKDLEYLDSEHLLRNNTFGKKKSLQTFPERILQFGHGLLFRKLKSFGFDFELDEVDDNRRVVIVTSNANHSTSELRKKDAAISRILFENEDWPEILAFATNPELKIILINKKLVRKNVLKDNIKVEPPFSLPGKILALLFNRFKYFKGETGKGVIIVSADQDYNSPEIVESIILELAHLNNLDPLFLDWIENCNRFYSSYT